MMSRNNQFVSFPITIINDHIIIDNEQKIILDTGSPMSFHKSGTFNIGERIEVPTSLPGNLKCDKYNGKKVFRWYLRK